MKFEKRDNEYILGKYFGYFLMLIIFSIILFFVLSFFKKIPESWNYFYVFFMSVFIVLIGKGIKFWLET